MSDAGKGVTPKSYYQEGDRFNIFVAEWVFVFACRMPGAAVWEDSV